MMKSNVSYQIDHLLLKTSCFSCKWCFYYNSSKLLTCIYYPAAVNLVAQIDLLM